MFQVVSNKEVRGVGFSVLVPNIHQAVYSEADHVATVEIEGGTDEKGQVNWLIYRDTFSGWLSPYTLDSISEKQRDDIISNISKSLSLLNMPHQIL
jgi:hypothetical protein